MKKKITKPAPSAAPASLDSTHMQVGNDDSRLKQVTTKTFLLPRSTLPRWSGFVDEFGGRFSGEIALGNGTQFRIGCFFDAQRHFWVAIPGVGAWQFLAGQRTTWQTVQEVLALEHEGDARNLADFINTQIDDGLDDNEYAGSYERRFCA